MPKPLIAVDKLLSRLRSSTYWIKENPDYENSPMLKEQVRMNEELIVAAEKAFRTRIEAAKDKEI